MGYRRALAMVFLAGVLVGGCARGPFVPLQVGQCLPRGAGVEGQRAQSPTTVACDEPHRYQVFAIVTLEPPDDAWPGEDLITVNAENRCAAEIEAATGLDPRDTPTDVELVHVDPSVESWRKGDREVECLFRWDSETTDTLVAARH